MLRNQIAFVTEGNDTALHDHGIPSIEATIRQAQSQFNRWLAVEEADRTSQRLIEMLGFDYFKLLDLLTIARSRKHVQKYYGTSWSCPSNRAKAFMRSTKAGWIDSKPSPLLR